MTRLLRRCCEDPEPAARPGKVTQFRKRPATPPPAAPRSGARRSDPRPVPPVHNGPSDDDAALPLPLIPPGLNEGFGLW